MKEEIIILWYIICVINVERDLRVRIRYFFFCEGSCFYVIIGGYKEIFGKGEVEIKFLGG